MFHESKNGQKRTIKNLELNVNINEKVVSTSEGANTNSALNAWECIRQHF